MTNCYAYPHSITNPSFRPCLHEYVFIENHTVFSENKTIVLHLHIVFVSFSYRLKTIENGKNQRKSIVLRVRIICGCCCIVSKVCVFSEYDPSTRQRYHYNNIVFKSLKIVKTIIVFDRFRVDAR